ncbi:phage protease [Candidatus Sororendozoicomonas aggregata]|uniref:phage protease n=1 Tax=Candidatus Sororendozoicomonas aggregata TaxID=3073239 RepID=UPI002ED5096A
MTTTHAPYPKQPDTPETVAVALNMQLGANGQPPEWLPLIPAGTFTGRDGRQWTNPNPELILAACRAVGRDIPLDIEHATEVKGPKGEPAPAQGWFRLDDLEARDGALWGRVEWNDSGRALVEGKAYKYYSPAFLYDGEGQVKALKSVGLTNTHNLRELPALNQQSTPPPDSEHHENPERGETDMPLSEAMRAALGLKNDASEADAIQAIGTLKTQHQTALNRAETPDPEKFVTKADYQLALNRATAAEARIKAADDQAIADEVDAAIKAGKVAPASKDYHLATCRQDGGLERFREFVKSAPAIVSTEAATANKKPGDSKTSLTDEQVALCQQMGISEDEFRSSLDDK